MTKKIILSDDSNESDKTDYVAKKAALVVWIREFKDYNYEDELMLKTLEETFLKMAVLKPHKLK